MQRNMSPRTWLCVEERSASNMILVATIERQKDYTHTWVNMKHSHFLLLIALGGQPKETRNRNRRRLTKKIIAVARHSNLKHTFKIDLRTLLRN